MVVRNRAVWFFEMGSRDTECKHPVRKGQHRRLLQCSPHNRGHYWHINRSHRL